VAASPGRPPPAFPRDLLAGSTLHAAAALLGTRLVRDPDPGDPLAERRVGRIVELEAYIGEDDRASHARMGPTDRNRVMFGPPGIAYVYLVYGMHHCLNVVTEPDGRPAALLVRAVEPLEGLDTMRAARAAASARRRSNTAGRSAGRVAAPGASADRSAPGRLEVADARLASGPALVCQAFSIDRSMTWLDLCDPASPLRLEAAPAGTPAAQGLATPRIGIDYSGEPWISVPWRLVDPASPSLSGKGAR
jgi:DNA-3-methyladenine glycosylase